MYAKLTLNAAMTSIPNGQSRLAKRKSMSHSITSQRDTMRAAGCPLGIILQHAYAHGEIEPILQPPSSDRHKQLAPLFGSRFFL